MKKYLQVDLASDGVPSSNHISNDNTYKAHISSKTISSTIYLKESMEEIEHHSTTNINNIKVLTVPATFTQQVYNLYCKYQTRVHNDKPDSFSTSKFTKFLVDSPLKQSKQLNGITYGTFHQNYYINGVLVACGVIDVLPNCVSAVYFMYDPDYSHLVSEFDVKV